MAKVEEIRSEAQSVTITLGGKERVLKYDMNAFGVLEQKFGTVEAAMESLTTGKIGNVKYLLWAGLIHNEVAEFDEDGEPIKYNITPYNVGAMIESPAVMASVVGEMSKAISSSLPTEAVEAEVGKPAPKTTPRRKSTPPKPKSN